MRACRCRAKACHAAGIDTRMRLVVLQAAFAAKVRRPRAGRRRRPAARSTAVAFGCR
jgi:hypothetical protein